MGQSRKLLCGQLHRGFESHPLRQIARGFLGRFLCLFSANEKPNLEPILEIGPSACVYRFCGKPKSTLLVAGSGQRALTTFPLVKKLIPSGPYMCVSPNRLAFQPPKL